MAAVLFNLLKDKEGATFFSRMSLASHGAERDTGHTGKQPPIMPQLSTKEANQILNDGRGWSNNDRNSAYDSASGETLMERLGSWSPIVRERAAIATAPKKISPEPLIKLLDSPSLETHLGACQALEQLKANAAPAVPALRKTLKADDLWLRVKAADATPDLLEMLIRKPPADDPRAMEQRSLCFVLFQERNGLLFKQLDRIDPELLKKAIRTGLSNQDGRARNCIAAIYPKLNPEQLKALMPDILEAVRVPAPSGEMFADGIRMSGLQILAQQRIKQGMESGVEYLTKQNPWGSEKRTALILPREPARPLTHQRSATCQEPAD